MKHQRYLWMTLLTGLSVSVGLSFSAPASAKYVNHSTTPTELRGTWYQYQGHHRWNKIVIKKHAFKLNGKTLYTPKKKSWHKLYILHHKKGQEAFGDLKGYGGTNYTFNGKFQADYQQLGNFWLSTRKIKGRRVMKSYYLMGDFSVYTRQKLQHNYNYHYSGKQFLNKIGR